MKPGPRSAMGDTPNSYCRDMTEALEADPPVITWRKGKGGVLVPVEIQDPHTKGRKPPAEDERRRRAVDRWELARLRALESMPRGAS